MAIALTSGRCSSTIWSRISMEILGRRHTDTLGTRIAFLLLSDSFSGTGSNLPAAVRVQPEGHVESTHKDLIFSHRYLESTFRNGTCFKLKRGDVSKRNAASYQPAFLAMQVLTASPPSKIQTALRIRPSSVNAASRARTAKVPMAHKKRVFMNLQFCHDWAGHARPEALRNKSDGRGTSLRALTSFCRSRSELLHLNG